MEMPSIYEDFNSYWWGDREILEDIADSEEANKVALQAMKLLKEDELEQAQWNTVISKKTTKTIKNKENKEKKGVLKSKVVHDSYNGVITNITKERGFIKSNSGELFVFNNTAKFTINDKVAFTQSTIKQTQRFKRAIKIKHMCKNT